MLLKKSFIELAITSGSSIVCPSTSRAVILVVLDRLLTSLFKVAQVSLGHLEKPAICLKNRPSWLLYSS